MADCNQKKIAAISMVRNDLFFISKWIKYYGLQFGEENLYLVLDGHDQPLPEKYDKINVIRVPHRKLSRTKGDRNRAKLVSNLAKSLFCR
jgi:hypothetical protein